MEELEKELGIYYPDLLNTTEVKKTLQALGQTLGGLGLVGLGSAGMFRFGGELFLYTTIQLIDFILRTYANQNPEPLSGDPTVPYVLSNLSMLIFAAGVTFYGFGAVNLEDKVLDFNEARLRNARRTRRIELFHPEWVNSSPSDDQLKQFLTAISYLPPYGGKVSVEGRKPRPLLPTLTAEEGVDRLLQKRNQLGKAYIYQSTIQGRLPDKFKYVASALLINSPYIHSWDVPYFDAPWGQIGPLVHDGGNLKFINKNWQVPGRTDFLQRMVKVYEPDLEKIEQLTTQELSQLPKVKIDKARLEQLERGRLFLEAKAFQRLALTFHAAEGNTPSHMDSCMTEQLSQISKLFIEEMDDTLADFKAHGIVEVPWFIEEGRTWKVSYINWKDRHEADWDPIKKQLQLLEPVRWQSPQLRVAVNGLLQRKTEEVDKIIGLKSF